MRKRNRSRKRTWGGFGLWGRRGRGPPTEMKMVDPQTGIPQIQNPSTGRHIIKPGGMGESSTPQKKAGIGMPAGMKMVDPQTGGPAAGGPAGIADRMASQSLTKPGFMRFGGSRRRKRTMKR